MEPLVALLVVVTLVLTTLLVVVFVYVIMILRQFRETVTHLNQTLKNSDRLIASITGPFENLGNAMSGLQTGLKFAEAFMAWLQEHTHDKKRLSD